MSTTTDLLSAGDTQDLYIEGSDKYECTNAGCRIKETAGAKHKACGKCGQAKYCSRACQVAHWPQHKPHCRAWRQRAQRDDGDDGTNRASRFQKKYGPLCGSIVQHLFPSKRSRAGRIAMVCLEELGPDHRAPRLEIKSVGRIAIAELPGQLRDVREHCADTVQRERDRVEGLGKDPDDVICALLAHLPTATFLLVPYVFHDEREPLGVHEGPDAAAVLDLGCQLEVDRLVKTINALARGGRKDLKSGTERPPGTK